MACLRQGLSQSDLHVPSHCQVENGPGDMESLAGGLWDPAGQLEESMRFKSEVLSWIGFWSKGSHHFHGRLARLEERLAHPWEDGPPQDSNIFP